MESAEWKWRTNDGLEMYSKAWIPSDDVKGVVCLLHGVGEHIGRHLEFAEALTTKGYVLAGFDQRGFGKSEGRRGHTSSLEMYLDDIDTFFGEIKQRYPEKPLFLYGMSMGAILALAYTPLRQPDVVGVIAVAPALMNALQEQKLKVLLAKLLGTIMPTVTFESGVDPEKLSRNPQVAEDVVNDPLVHFFITTSWGKTMMGAIDIVYENAHRFPKPLLLMHGSKDELSYPRGTQKLSELAPEEMVTLKIWEGFKHELNDDPESADVFSTVINWLETQKANQAY